MNAQFVKNSEKSNIISVKKYNKNPNKCLYCGKEIVASINDKVSDVKTKKFCNKTCSVKYNNLHRDKSVYQKLSKKLTKQENIKICKYCGNEFHAKSKRQVFCSKYCRQNSYGTKQNFVMQIKQFININGHIPIGKMNINWQHKSRKFFGSWNKMIECLGYKPNNQKYCKGIYKCKDGHISDSLSQKVVDDWLYENNIKHQRRKKYPNSKKDCDFYLNDLDIWLQYFGLANENEEYDNNIKQKFEIAKKFNLKLIGIYQKDLYPNNCLKEKILII